MRDLGRGRAGVIALAWATAGLLAACGTSLPPAPGPGPRPGPRPFPDAGCPFCPGPDGGTPPPPPVDAGPIAICEQPLGAPCGAGSCGRITCVRPTTTTLTLEDGTTTEATRFPAAICSARCATDDPGSCGDCGVCLPYSLHGRARIDLGASLDGICRPRCETGCPIGYACDAETGACLEGCLDDATCAITGEDTDGDGLDDVLRSEPGLACDPVTFECVPEGTMRSCASDAECGAAGVCLRSSAGTSMCVARECERCIEGTTCVSYSGGGPRTWACARACEPFAEPPEARLGPSGHGAGCLDGFACIGGACLPGSYNEVTDPTPGRPCSSAADCYSPYGLAECVALAGMPSRCVIDCATAIAGGADATLVCDPSRFACDSARGCVDACIDAEECAPGQACGGEPTRGYHTCTDHCMYDAECREGERCAEADGSVCSAGEVCACAPGT